MEQWAVTTDDKLAVFGPFWPPQVGGTLYAGGTIAAYDFAVRGPGGVWQWMRDQRITFASTYTAIFRALPVEGEAKLPDLRLFRLMGEPLYRADAERFEQIAVPGTVFANGYGSNDFAFIAAYNHRVGDPIRFEAMPMGPLTKPEWISLAGADGMPVPQGEIGEIVVHCPFGPTRYLNDPERTAEVFRPFPAAGGATAYFTGDQGYLDRQGILHPVGRVDEQTKIRGYTVRPSDVETSLRRISGIAQAAVVPNEGPNGIRRLVCHYVLAENASLTGADIKAALREVLPGYMVPSDYIRHEALPVTSSGKVLRRALPGPDSVRGGNGGGHTAPGGETERQVADIWREVLGHGDFGVDADFFDVGGDSLQAMSLIVGIEARFGVRIPLETLILKAATVRELAAMIDAGGSGVEPMTALNRGGPLPALSAVPVIGGHLSDYLALAHALDGAHPVRGLSFAEVQDLAEAGSVASLARHSIERLLDEAQGEPIHLLGYSFGGIVAYEVARQLQERNIPAASLIMIDADAPWAEPIPWLRSVWRAAARGDLGASSRRLQELVSAQLDRPSTVRSLDEAHFVAMHRYRPAPVHLDRALLIVSEERHNADTTVRAWGEMLGGGFEIRRAQGNHYAMMRTPHVEALGYQIKEWLAQATGSA